MEHFVQLEELPEGLEFPDHLRDRIRYDFSKKRLVFSGHMCKADYDRLLMLHDDAAYRRAMEELFRIAINGDAGGGTLRNTIVGVLIAVAILTAAGALAYLLWIR